RSSLTPYTSCRSTTRPTPNSTPLPYTTLFRSAGAAHRLRGLEPLAAKQPRGGAADRSRWTGGAVHARDRARGRLALEDRAAAPEDRKSTRLNSSHVKTSYAVFCLKKK